MMTEPLHVPAELLGEHNPVGSHYWILDEIADRQAAAKAKHYDNLWLYGETNDRP